MLRVVNYLGIMIVLIRLELWSLSHTKSIRPSKHTAYSSKVGFLDLISVYIVIGNPKETVYCYLGK